MTTRNRITIRQTQRLSLNTRLLSSIKLLASDSLGLSRFLEEAAANNPALVVEAPAVNDWVPRWRDAFARAPGGVDLSNVAESAEPGLIAHVEAAIGTLRLDSSAARIARFLVEALEPTGWLGLPLSAVAANAGASVAAVETVLIQVQRIEPAGLFSRNLSECLRLQAADEGWLDPLAEAVLTRLPIVASGDAALLASLLDASEAAILAVIRRLRRLDPKPGARFGPCAAPVREPDLIATRGPGGWEVALNHSALPSLRLADGPGRAEAKALLRLVEGRNTTLLRVATEILTRQAAALEHGTGALQPMVMTEVAESLGLAQSTVSRAVAGTSVDTPMGTWWLRELFSQAIRGNGPAAASLREGLARMIAAEDPGKPMTDDDLSRALAGAGAPVARRTVAKYRSMLGIPPAHLRRRRDVSGRSQ